MEEPLRFFCGTSHRYWSWHLSDPGPLACISPIVGRGSSGFGLNNVYVPPDTLVFQDSGAYGEPLSSSSTRLTFSEALKRQEQHAERYSYAQNIAYRATYDLLIDHRFEVSPGSSRRRIQRCAPADGELAIEVSVQAARFLHVHRNGYPLALNVQGVTPAQYLRCVEQVVPLLRDGDTLGLGGWCILGRMPVLMSDFLETLALVVPFLAREGVKRVHLYGSIYTPAIAALLAICDHHTLELSLDSAFPSYAPQYGMWGFGVWRRKHYSRPKVLVSCYEESCSPDARCMGLECIRHVQQTRDWLTHFRQREPRLYWLHRRHLDQYQYGQIIDFDDVPDIDEDLEDEESEEDADVW